MPFNSIELAVVRHSVQFPASYRDLDRLQCEIAHRVRRGQSGALFLAEVAPVITLGRRAKAQIFPDSTLPTLATHRGGLATYHGPGQWVLFIVDRISRLVGEPRGVRACVQKLLEVLHRAATPFGPHTIHEAERLGVWNERGQKVGSVGIAIQGGIVTHGIALNGYKTKESFLGVNPCGLDAEPGYLIDAGEKEQAKKFEFLGAELVRSACEVFGLKIYVEGVHSHSHFCSGVAQWESTTLTR